MNKILLSLLLFGCLFTAFGAEDVLNLPGDNKEATKEEKGILLTLTNAYMSVRTAVSYCYDEIIYYENIHQNYKDIVAWIKRNKKLVASIGDNTVNLFTDFECSFDYLDRVEKIFDDIDNLALVQTKEFDNIMWGLEKNWDGIAQNNYTFSYGGHTKTIRAVPGLIIPNVDQTLSFFHDYLPSSQIQKTTIEGAPQTVNENYSYLDIDDEWPEQKLKLVSEAILSSTTAKSNSYKKWSDNSRYNLDYKIDPSFKDLKDVNGNDLASAYYALLSANEQNQRLYHSLEEVKTLSQILGIDVFNNAKKVIEQKEVSRQAFESRVLLKQAAQK
jgi:hypothetical protein